jgi:DNA-binding transcriptional LysR family regulator
MDLRLLRYFVAVAEVEHIGRAADHLRISQSPLSRQIRQLEQSLNLRLFDRERQRVKLTEAGRWFHKEAKELLARAERLQGDANRVARGEIGTFSVGFVKGAMWSDVLPDALRRLRALHPELNVALHNLPSAAQIEALKRHDLDVCFLHTPPEDAAVISTCVLEEPLLLAMPVSHRLAGARTIAAKDLDSAAWISWPGPQQRESRERLLAACRRAGFSPAVKYEAQDPSTALALVGAGLGLTFIPASLQRYPHKGVTVRRLAWLGLPIRIYMVRNRSGLGPVTEEFVRIASKASS